MTFDTYLLPSPHGTRAVAALGLVLAALAGTGCDAGGLVTLTGGSSGAGGGGGGGGDTATTATTGSSSTASTSSTSTTTAGTGGGDCGPGVTSCGDVCVNLTNDPAHCGACDAACEPGLVCTDSECVLECVGGATECGDACVDLMNDPANCGGCGDACDPGLVCSRGACGLVCLGGTTSCDGLCFDTDVDPLHCGDCDTVCGADEVCSDGTCDATCLGGTTLCGALCKDLQSDPANCGVCELACPFRSSCLEGLCSAGPTVLSTNPADGALGVALDREVQVVFSEPMDELTINEGTFIVMDGATPVPGDVTYDDVTETATFIPAVDYATNAVLTATVTTGAEDLSGQGLVEDFVFTFETGLVVGQPGIDLGLASPFAILAFNTVTNVDNPGTIVTGDLGISPGGALVGFPPGVVVGTLHVGDAVASDAQLALLAAYSDAAGRLGAAVLPGDLSGLTFTPGVYAVATSTMLSAGNVTLDAQGDAEAVFIFQVGTTLTTGNGTAVVLAGGAKASNVYWSVGTSATFGSTSTFKGNVLAASAITMVTGATIEGRLLAQGAAVALDTNLITVPLP